MTSNSIDNMNIHPAKLGFDIASIIFEDISQRLVETESPIAVYPGRFQPFHAGHFSVYKQLVNQFGADRVFIVTSDKTDSEKSPLSFEEKRQIMVKMFGIPPENIVQVRSPYAPEEVVKNFPQDTPLVVAMSEKDKERLGSGKYYRPWGSAQGDLEGFRNRGYYVIAPEFQMQIGNRNISGTAIRDLLMSPTVPDHIKKSVFEKLYGRFDDSVYQLITGKRVVKKAPEEKIKRSKKRMGDLMKAKITNPETDNQILVATALKYDKSHPAYRAAASYVQKYLGEGILLEGGAAGHMMHPYEDPNLKFSDLEEMIKQGLLGDFGGEASEKLDGQNIMFTVVNGEVRFARNKGHIKNGGEQALNADALRQMFAGRGDLERSFGDAADDIQAAINNLTPRQIEQIFGSGHNFVNVEIINPATENAIPYGKNVLVFHNAHSFDDAGNMIGLNADMGKFLAKSLQDVNASRQKTYGMQGPNSIVFSDADNKQNEELANKFIQDLHGLRQKYNLGNDATIGDYRQAWWMEQLSSIPTLTDEQKIRLARRWGLGDKSAIGVKDFADSEQKNWFREMEKNMQEREDALVRPLQSLVLKVGAASLKRVSNLIAAHNPLGGEELRNRVQKAIEQVRRSGAEDKVGELERQLSVLQSVGMDNILPSEGMVFIYNGQPYKFTGAFAPTNRILGLMRYGSEEPKKIAAQEPRTTEPPRRDVPPENVPSKRMTGSMMGKKIVNPITKRNILIQTALKYPEDHPAFRLAQQVLKRG